MIKIVERLLNLRALTCILYLVVGTTFLSAQDDPSWVLLGKANTFFDQQNFSPAILILRQAIQRKGIYPEAEWLLGKVLGVTGDLTIQREQFKKALDESDLLDIPANRWEILYDLDTNAQFTVGLTKRDQFILRKSWLTQILDADEDYQNAMKAGSLESYNRVFFEEFPWQVGMDRILFLFRSQPNFATRAHQRISRLYLEAGAPQLALNHALFAFIALMTRALDEFVSINPDWEYTNLSDIFISLRGGAEPGRVGTPIRGALQRYQHLWNYLEEVNIGETLWLMASSAHQIENAEAKKRALEIIKLLKEVLPEWEWGQRPLLPLQLKP